MHNTSQANKWKGEIIAGTEVTWHSSINRKQAENRRDQISVNSRAHKKIQTHFKGLRRKYKCNPYDNWDVEKTMNYKSSKRIWHWIVTLYITWNCKRLMRKLCYSVLWFLSPRGKIRNSSPYQNKGCAPWKTLWASEAENQGLSRPFDCNHQYLGYVYLSPFVCLVTFLTNAGNDVIQ